MISYIHISKVVRTAAFALLAAAGLWLGASIAQISKTATGDAVADGGQWGNKGGRSLVG